MFQGRRFSLARAMQLYVNSLKHRMQIACDLGIPKANDAISFLFQPKLSFLIPRCGFIFIMMSAVQFDDQAGGLAEKVHHVGADRRLPPEMCALYREFFQSTPQCALVRSGSGPQSFGGRTTDRCGDHNHLARG